MHARKKMFNPARLSLVQRASQGINIKRSSCTTCLNPARCPLPNLHLILLMSDLCLYSPLHFSSYSLCFFSWIWFTYPTHFIPKILSLSHNIKNAELFTFLRWPSFQWVHPSFLNTAETTCRHHHTACKHCSLPHITVLLLCWVALMKNKDFELGQVRVFIYSFHRF